MFHMITVHFNGRRYLHRNELGTFVERNVCVSIVWLDCLIFWCKRSMALVLFLRNVWSKGSQQQVWNWSASCMNQKFISWFKGTPFWKRGMIFWRNFRYAASVHFFDKTTGLNKRSLKIPNQIFILKRRWYLDSWIACGFFSALY